MKFIAPCKTGAHKNCNWKNDRGLRRIGVLSMSYEVVPLMHRRASDAVPGEALGPAGRAASALCVKTFARAHFHPHPHLQSNLRKHIPFTASFSTTLPPSDCGQLTLTVAIRG